MLKEFRFDVAGVDVVDDPGKIMESEEFMNEKRQSKFESVEKKAINVAKDKQMPEKDRQMATKYYLYLNSKILEEHDKSNPSLTIVSLPVPSGNASALLYHSWMDIMTNGLGSDCLMVRGNQEAAITFLSQGKNSKK